MVTREQIENTEAFKKLEATKKMITAKKWNIDYLKQNFIMAKKMGYENWLKICGTSNSNKLIIKELLDKNDN